LELREGRQALLVEGDLVVVKSSGSAAHLGKTAIVTKEVADMEARFANFVQRLRPANNAHSRYLWYLLNSSFARRQLELLGTTTTGLRNLNGELIGSIECPGPPLHEQRAIADFLDAETTRIDALIAKKRKLAALLLARVESLVSERLREIERQRGFVPLKSVANVRVSNVDKKTVEGEQNVRLCNYTDVYYTRKIDPDTDFMTASATREQIQDFGLRSGDVLITKDSETADDIGIPAYVPEDMPGVVLGYHTALIRPHRVDGHYLYWVLRRRRSRDHFTITASGVTRFGLRQGDIGSLLVPAATASEQTSISGEIEDSITYGERAMDALERQITLLAEHRQALITAAVTGQIGAPGAGASTTCTNITKKL